MEGSDHDVPYRACCGDGNILQINECCLNKLPMDSIGESHSLEICLDNQSLNFKGRSIQRNDSDDSHLAIKERVDIDATEVKSYLSGSWNKINPSLIDIQSFDVDFVNLNIISESALLNF
jgi:hypothetical protein